ncbi:MAG: hypothetical protein PHE55_22160 [Methylococcaceae bacterium]|nr:hypothetical protein [Methylococcaceae bacterium]
MSNRQDENTFDPASGSRPVYYRDRTTQVMLGDLVETRIWFRKQRGKIVYVPGISKLNPEMERDGLRWVGISLNGGGFIAQVIDPKDNFLIKPVILLNRSDIEIGELGPQEDPFGDDSFPSP